MSVTVLMIEDNEQNRYLATFLLQANDFHVVSVPDGHQGIEAAASLLPDIILLDIQLPSMDGYTVAQKLRSIPQLGATPIVAVTSYAMVGDREKALEAGCNGYIEKPIDPDTFVQSLRTYLSQEAGH